MTPYYQDNKIIIHKIKCGPYDNNSYVLVCPETNESLVIDAPANPEEIIDIAIKTTVKSILITHNHMDHIQGLSTITSYIKTKIGIGKPDDFSIPRHPDFFFEDISGITCGTITLKVLSTPGHTPGSTCFLFDKHVFTGDTLFPGGPGKTRTPSDFKQILLSINSKLLGLAQDCNFYPGNGEDSTIEIAREEYDIFTQKDHPENLYGDVLWLKS